MADKSALLSRIRSEAASGKRYIGAYRKDETLDRIIALIDGFNCQD